MHALHAVHALPDLRVAAGRLRDGVSVNLRPSHHAQAFTEKLEEQTEPHILIICAGFRRLSK
jgi:hypothetical protein